jgi:hypothetical protein
VEASPPVFELVEASSLQTPLEAGTRKGDTPQEVSGGFTSGGLSEESPVARTASERSLRRTCIRVFMAPFKEN